MTYKPFLNEETRTSVLAAVKTGSEAAWSRFFDLYAGYVFSLARRAGLIGADADDLVQTVFAELSAPDGFEGYERGKGAFRPWLRQRVCWRIADALRRRAAAQAKFRRADEAFFDSLPSPPDARQDACWIEAARDEALRRLRAEVSAEHFAIFQASVLEELPTEDVMALYHVSRHNVYQIRKRLKAALQRHLAAALDDLDSPIPPCGE